MADLLTLADVKAQLNITSTTYDTELGDYISAATDLVEWRTGPMSSRQITDEFVDLIGRTIYNELTTAGTRAFVLRTTPVISIDNIASGILSGVTTYTAADFFVDSATGIVRRYDGGTIFGPLKVTYTVGRTSIPKAVNVAARIIVQHLWETQRGPSPANLQLSDVDNTTAGMFWDDIPNRAKMLLEPFVVGPPVG